MALGEVRDSRRLTGPNVLWARPGACLEVALDDADRERAVDAWRAAARRLLDAVGWADEDLCTRTFAGGASLALSAPLDALYAATEVNEAAWALAGDPDADEGEVVARLRREIEEESNPALAALLAAAASRGVDALVDDDELSLGLGARARVWPVGDLPAPDAVPWDELGAIPVALVTGTNGKTTTVRLLAEMVRAAGRVAGLSSTDWIRIGDEIVDRDDWSGPGGGRRVLRDPRTEVAILETARGGMLRRGLAVTRADVALVTNVAEDHLGEWGVLDLGMLADTKMVVARAGARLVLNADDPELVARADATGRPVDWFTLDAADARVAAHVEAGGRAAFLADGDLVLADVGASEVVLPVAEAPFTLGGAARHNVANALGAILVAVELGLPLDAVRGGLRTFACSPDANPGRLNVFDVGGVRAVVDFAHNPHGYEAFFEMAARSEAARKLVVLGQAGDRDDDSIRELVRIAWRAAPDRVVVKEMPEHLRGRPVGEVPAVIRAELRALGAAEDAVEDAPDELAAVEQALAWARPGDLLCLLTHSRREEVLDLLARRAQDAG